MLPVSTPVVAAELESVKIIMDKWLAQFRDLPDEDMASEEEMGSLLREFCGELRVVAGKCETLSEIFSEILPA